jgi:hypothetical protein
MKRFVLLFIFVFSLSLAKTLLVPEEFLTIQSVVGVAKNYDTVSVNFGRSNGERPVVCSQLINGKTITFEVRGEGKEELFDILQRVNKLPMTLSDSGWTRQSLVNRLDSTSDLQPCIAIDSFDKPWVVWSTNDNNHTQFYTMWNGLDWDAERGVGSNAPGVWGRLLPSISFDNQNTAWLVWHNAYENNNGDIAFSRWDDTCWTPEGQVNMFDSTELDFAPKIAYGGGQIWCVWYGGPTDVSNYKIYVSRWNGTGWEPEIQISPEDNRRHWFCDITVDNLGRPHVVWGAVSFDPGIVYYRTYNGTTWLAPEALNNPQAISAAGWPLMSISIDNEGGIHVVWTGFSTGQNQTDVFYSKKINNTWLAPVQLNTPDAYNDYPYIIAKEPNDIWASWGKEAPSSIGNSFVSNYNGLSWSPEERLDDSLISYWNGIPQIVYVNNDNGVWTVWDGFTRGINSTDIYYSRCLHSSISETQSNMLSVPCIVIGPNPFHNTVTLSYKKDTRNHTFIGVYDLKGSLIRALINREEGIGNYCIIWDGDNNNKKVSNGIYFVLLKSGQKKEIKKIIFLR